MASCENRNVDLRRGDRVFISWPTTGIASTDLAFVSLENGAWLPLDIGIDEVIGYFAGPDYVDPGAARVVPLTSHTQIRVIDAETTQTFDGGFIQLVP